MWALLVVEANPVANDPQGMDLALKAVAMHALLLECPDYALHHPVLLRAVRRDEFLFQAVAAHQARVVTAGEDQTVIRAQQERLRHTSQRAKAGDQGLLQSG